MDVKVNDSIQCNKSEMQDMLVQLELFSSTYGEPSPRLVQIA